MGGSAVGFHYLILEEERVVSIELFNRVDLACLDKMRQEFDSNPKYTPDLNILCDLSQLAEIDLNFAQMMQAISMRSAFYEQCTDMKMAFWAPQDLPYGMARMFSSLIDRFPGVTAGVFRDWESAVEFSGCDPQVFETRDTGTNQG